MFSQDAHSSGTISGMRKNATLSGLAMKAAALAVFLVCAYVLFKIVMGVVAAVAWIAVIALAIVGLLWALRTLV
jgi:hypothetical protein